MKNLKNLKVVELNAQEVRSIEGGYSWDEFVSDVKSAYNKTVSYLKECCEANNDPRSGIITQKF